MTSPRLLPIWTIPARIAAVIALFALGLGALMLLTADASGDATLLARVGGGAVISAVVIAALVLLTRVAEHRRLRDLGISGPADAWRAFLTGALAWIIPATVSFVVLTLLGSPIIVHAPGTEIARVALLVFLAVLLSEAIPEELVFRGYVQRVLSERLPTWPAILVQAALFTTVAVLLRGAVSVTDVSLFVSMGIGLGYLRQVTDSVWTPVGVHVAFQTGAQLILGGRVLSFDGSELSAMIALGVVPFTVAAIALSVLVPVAPALVARPQR